MIRTKKEYYYVEVWSEKVSERVYARISRMIDPAKEREFYNNEEYLKRVENAEEYERQSKKRIQFKNDTEKYYINAQVTGFDGSPFRTKGFSITRKDIPNMIDALQKIVGGEFDSQIKYGLVESGILQGIKEEVEQELEEENIEKEEEEEKFLEWCNNLTEPEKKEVEIMKKSGWTEKEIKIAFEFHRIKKT